VVVLDLLLLLAARPSDVAGVVPRDAGGARPAGPVGVRLGLGLGVVAAAAAEAVVAQDVEGGLGAAQGGGRRRGR